MSFNYNHREDILERIEWMGGYRNGDHQKTSMNTEAITNIVLFTRLNAQEQRELQGRMEKKQMKEFMTVSLVLLCALRSCTSRLSLNQLCPRLCSSRATRCTRGWSRGVLTTV